MTDIRTEREIVEAFIDHIKATPRVYIAVVLNSGASIDAHPAVIDELVRTFVYGRMLERSRE